MKKILLILLVLGSQFANCQWSVLKARQYPYANTLGYVPVSYDSSGFHILFHVKVSDLLSAGGATAWGAITGTLSSQTDLQTALNAKQAALSGTGFVKISGTTISYDNNTYLTSITGTGLDNVFSSNGLLKRTGAGTYTVDASTYLTGNQSITLSNDISGSGATAISATVNGLKGVALPSLGASAGLLKYTGTGTNTWIFDNNTYLTGNQSVTWTASTDISGSASGATSISPSLTVVGIRGVSVPALSAGFLKYTGAAWTYDASTYLTANQTISFSPTGDVTGSTAGTTTIAPALTIGSNVVTYAKFQQVGASSLVGNPTVSTANAQGITLGATLSFSSNALQTAALTGDVTTSANSFVTAIGANRVTSAMLRQGVATSVMGVSGGSTANEADIQATADGQFLSRQAGALTWQLSGGIASMTAASSAINTTETILLQKAIPANTMVAGTTYRITVYGTCTSSVANASNIRVRLGTAGTTSDAVVSVLTPTAAASGTTIPFKATLMVTIRTTGGGTGTTVGNGDLNNNGVTGISAAADVIAATTTTSALNTTVQNTLSLTYVSAATTTTSTFQLATIEIVKM